MVSISSEGKCDVVISIDRERVILAPRDAFDDIVRTRTTKPENTTYLYVVENTNEVVEAIESMFAVMQL